MSTRRNKRRSQQVSEHVQNVPENTFLPPGSGESAGQSNPPPEANDDFAVDIGEEQPKEGSEYPQSKVTDEATHKAQEEAAAQERVARAKQVSGPKRLSSQEMLDMTVLLEKLPKDENVPLNTPIMLEELSESLKNSFFTPGARSMHHRGLVKLLQNPETKQYDRLEITEIGFHLYQKQSGKLKPAAQKSKTKANGAPRAVGGRASNKYEGLRMRKMADNPRAEGTMGYFSWQLYKDGMTYKEYMETKDFPQSVSSRTQEVFRGPGRNHWDWDLMHGFIALYRDGEDELLSDGSPNPNYWVINNARK